MFGLALRIVREMRGLTQDQLGYQAKISRGTVIDYESGKQATEYGLANMLQVLDVREGLIDQFGKTLEALWISLETGQETLDLRPAECDEQVAPEPPAPAVRPDSLELHEPVTAGPAGIERVVLDGARFLRSFLQWVVATLAPKPLT